MAAEAVGAGGSWRLWVDTGGTFTDCLAHAPDGELHRFKLLSDGTLRGRIEADEQDQRCVRLELPFELPDDFLVGLEVVVLGDEELRARVAASRTDGRLRLAEDLVLGAGSHAEIRFADEVPVLAARIATRTPPGAELPTLDMRLATTRATNALLERSGAPTALFITAGFGDLLAIGSQQRRDLFALAVEPRRPFHSTVVEVDERLDATGEVVRPLAIEPLRRRARELVDEGCVSAAVVLVNSYANGEHEERVARELEAEGFEHVTRSAAVAPLIGALARGETAVVNAYLAPHLVGYLERVEGPLAGGSLRLMTSAGGLQNPRQVRPKDCLLSGPAGGVVGAVRAAAEIGVGRVISFDMGGTSTDVARYDGEYDYRFETELGEARVLAPSLRIETVAAGGGSICSFEAGRLRVGPRSAGARPGPACYGAGGPLTLTDVNLLLGRLEPDHFEIPLFVEAAESALARLLDRVGASDPAVSAETALAGLLAIADERMAEAIRRISVRHGYDPEEYLLVAFGGAGGQHACAVGELLGVRRVLVPGDASLLSAWGLGHAVVERFAERQVLARADGVEPRLEELLAELELEARQRVEADGVPAGEVVTRRRLLALRLAGQDATLTVEHRSGEPVDRLFAAAYREHFGYEAPARPVEIESVRVVASSRPPSSAVGEEAASREARPMGSRRALLGGSWGEVPVYERAALEAGDGLEGPALVVERFSAVVVAGGWHCRTTASRGLLLEWGGR